MGVRFTEVSFSVLVCGPKPEARQDAVFLVSAFNSSRIFALCERTFFATPYQHADCRVSTASPVSIRLVIGGEGVFSAEMRADNSPTTVVPSRTGQGSWEGPIFLPKRRRGSIKKSYLFFGKMLGHTKWYPFVRDQDAVSIVPSRQVGVLQAMVDSVFIGQEWIVRDDATHARSRTFKRSAVKLWES
jgi:hypothetical protein